MLNQLIMKTMPLIPKGIIKSVAKKYIAGPKLEDAIRVTQELQKINGMSTIDVLGEFVSKKEETINEKQMSAKVIKAIYDNKMPSTLSMKPTSLGLGIDVNLAYENISELVKIAKEKNIYTRLDMENSPYTDKTLDLYRKLQDNGFDNVGLVFQAYMRRTEDDIKSLLKDGYKPTIRLCKGIYRESPDIAYQSKEEIRENYKKLMRLIFENNLYIGVATHDEILILDALKYINDNKIGNDKFEFQMLLGVREKRRDEILALGHKLRVYVPFGDDWYGYATRRLKENPDMAFTITKAIFIKN